MPFNLVHLTLLTFIVGVIIHVIVLRLPTFLFKSWERECFDYLNHRHPHLNIELSVIKNDKSSWKKYFPFFHADLFLLDIALFLGTFIIFHYFHTNSFVTCASLILTWALLAASFIDIKHQILPDEITYFILWLGLFFSSFHLFTSPKLAILSTIIAYISLSLIAFLFRLIRKKEGLGQGDIKLFAAIAAWTGLMSLPLILFLASSIALVFLVLRFLIRPSSKLSAPLAFGPFLALSAWLVLLWGSEIYSFFKL